MTRSVRTVCLVACCMIAALAAHADSTTVLYQGPTSLVYGEPAFLKAVAFTTGTGVPLAGSQVTFTLGATSVNATVDSNGFASTFMTVTAPAGTATMSLSFAGDALHAASRQDVPVTILPEPSAIILTLADTTIFGVPTAVTASLVDVNTGAPIPGKLLHFSTGSSVADVLTDGSGVAKVSLRLPCTGLGAQSITVTFAGDANVLPSSAQAPTFVFVPSPFVIWGGNAGGVHEGDHVVFFAPDWAKQVTGGDYQAASAFKGLIDIHDLLGNMTILTSPCGAAPCWTAKPGDQKALPTPSVISVLVSTKIVQQRGCITGNSVGIAIIGVDSSPTAKTRTGTVLHLVRGAPQGD
jgi:hypothetical protein